MAATAPLHYRDDATKDSQRHDTLTCSEPHQRRTPVWTTRTPPPEEDPSSVSAARTGMSESSPPDSRHPSGIQASYLPSGSRSLAGISLRAFILGIVLGLGIALTSLLLLLPHLISLDDKVVILARWRPLLQPFFPVLDTILRIFRLWRPCFFLSALAVFHFLEFYTTAAYNTERADVGAFLLTTNGMAYNAAHTGALLECIITSLFFPHWQSRFTGAYTALLGLAFVIVGQVTRSAAMATAATNFNHTVQKRHSAGHVLVTHGIYAWLRHPSYFGFFWWGVGTQLVLGNKLCFLAYAVILWRFFRSRIAREEEYLIRFFGRDYRSYRAKVGVGIPFI